MEKEKIKLAKVPDQAFEFETEADWNKLKKDWGFTAFN